jgi:formylglycine-generating enzyme required for sulfatase activity
MLRKKCKPGDTALVAFAGHGLQFTGKPDAYFCPVDARPFADETATLVSLRRVYAELERSFAGVKVLLVDACRNDPESSRGLDDTAPRPPRGVAALFSCSAGERAFETAKLGGGHGVFFHFVIQGLRGEAKNRRGVVTWHSLAEYVTEQVSDEVPKVIRGGARQTPHQIFEVKGKSPVLLAVADSRPERTDSRVERPRKAAKEVRNSIGMKLVLIPAGTFMMGSPAGESGRSDDEQQHEVEITKSFYLGVTEVTQKQYRDVMKTEPSYFSATGGGKKKVERLDTDNLPVEMVSWDDAQTFLDKLSDLPEEKKKGRKYRLPTEAEWEYSCRGGAPSKNPFHFGPSLSSTQANFNDTLGRTCAVGSYPANRFGLKDMHGNVWEWCHDWYDKDYYSRSPRKDPKGPATGTARVLRGGSWVNLGHDCRSAGRYRYDPGDRDINGVGFRVAVSLPPRTP